MRCSCPIGQHHLSYFLLSFGRFGFAVFPMELADFPESLAIASLLSPLYVGDPGYLAFLSPYVSWYLKCHKPKSGDSYRAFASGFHIYQFSHKSEPLGSFSSRRAAFVSFFMLGKHCTTCSPLSKTPCPTPWKKLFVLYTSLLGHNFYAEPSKTCSNSFNFIKLKHYASFSSYVFSHRSPHPIPCPPTRRSYKTPFLTGPSWQT